MKPPRRLAPTRGRRRRLAPMRGPRALRVSRAPLRGPRALRVSRAPLRGPRAPLQRPKRPKQNKQKKRKKLKVPAKIPLKPRGGPQPSYFELLQEAVLTLREAGKGASLPFIRQQLQKKYRGRFDKESNDLLTTALQRLAERGKVICKEGRKYKFNVATVSKSTDASGSSSYSGTTRSGPSQSGATNGSAPSKCGATTAKNVDSHTSASSSFSETNRSNESPDDGPKEAESSDNVDGEGKSSAPDLSSSAISASSTASRAPSKRR